MLVDKKNKLHNELTSVSDQRKESMDEISIMKRELNKKDVIIYGFKIDKNEAKNKMRYLYQNIKIAEDLADKMSTSEDKCVTKISNVLFQNEELLAQKEALDKNV